MSAFSYIRLSTNKSQVTCICGWEGLPAAVSPFDPQEAMAAAEADHALAGGCKAFEGIIRCVSCRQEVSYSGQHNIATPEGDAWLCLPGPRPVESKPVDHLTELGHILDLSPAEPWTWELVLKTARALMAIPHPMYLTCPKCNGRHIDEGLFATKPHHTHSCQYCGLTWRPMIASTVGVQFLPGFKNG